LSAREAARGALPPIVRRPAPRFDAEPVDDRRVEERIREIFRDQLDVEVPSAATDLFETGALDSLGFVDLMAALAEEFDVHVVVETLEIADLRTIAAIAAFVAREGGR
jgi:acyl carrier protein